MTNYKAGDKFKSNNGEVYRLVEVTNDPDMFGYITARYVFEADGNSWARMSYSVDEFHNYVNDGWYSLIKEAPKCKCDIKDLMICGCRCGYIQIERKRV